MPLINDTGTIEDVEPAKLAGKPRGKHRRDENPLAEVSVEARESTPPLQVPVETREATPPIVVDPARRIKEFTPRTQQALPTTVGWLSAAVFAGPEDVAAIGKGLDNATAWTDAQLAFAGQPGGLIAMQHRAMKIEDPVLQREALDFVQALSQLPIDQQQAFINWQKYGSMTPEARQALEDTSVRIGGALGTESFTGVEVAGGGKRPPSEKPAVTGLGPEAADLTLAGEDISINLKVMLKQMFPTLAVRIGPHMDNWEEVDEFFLTPVEADGLANWLYNNSGPIQNATDIAADINANKRSIASAIFPLAITPVGIGTSLLLRGGGNLLKTAGAGGVQQSLDQQLGALAEDVGMTFKEWAAEGFTIRTLGDTEIAQPLSALDPNDPDYEWKIQQRLGAFGLLTLGVGGAVAPTIGRRLKLARSVPGVEAASAVLESSRSIRRGGILGTAAEVVKMPIRELTKQLDQQLLRFARDPEAWWKAGIRTPQGKKIVQVMEEAKRVHPDNLDGQLGFVAEVYGTGKISPKLARVMLEQTSPEGMRRAFVDFLTNTPGKLAISELRTTRRVISRRIAKLESQLDEARAARAAEATVTLPTDVARQYLEFPGFGKEARPEGQGVGTAGPPLIEYDPVTGKAIISESHRRTENIEGSLDYEIKVVDTATVERQGALVTRRTGPSGTKYPARPAQILPDEIRDMIDRQLQNRLPAEARPVDPTNGLPEPWREVTPDDPDNAWDPALANQVEYIRIADLRRLEGQPQRAVAKDLGELGAQARQAGFKQAVDRRQVDAIKATLPENGFDAPIEVEAIPDTGRVFVFNGNHRLQAAEELGLEWVPVFTREVAFIPEGASLEQIRIAYNPVHNRTLKELFPDRVTSIGDDAKRFLDVDAKQVELDRLKLELDQTEWRMKTTQSSTPMLKYPTRSHIRALVRAPVTRFEKTFHWVFQNRVFDAAKLVDELPKFPELFVAGGSHFPADGLERNIDTLSRYMRQAGVSSKIIQERIGELSGTKSARGFYVLVEEKIFGKGGDIDRALNKAISPELRDRIIYLHDSPIEGRTRSVIHEDATSASGTHRVNRPVLAREVRPGEFTPVPSSPDEFLHTLRLPDVDFLHDANSAIRRLAARVRSGGLKGRLATEALYDVPKAILGLSTAIMKPLVMLVRLPAMAMRIQMEQSLRIGALGYRPFKGIPNGISLLPGGIPVPFTQGKSRFLSRLFGEDGWELLAPDPRYKGFMDPNASETGMFMTELMDGGQRITTAQSSLDFRTGRRVPKRQDYEAWRLELASAHGDFLKRQIVISNFDVEKVKAWLESDFRAGEYMARDQLPVLRERAGAAGITIEAQINDWLNDQVTYLRQMTHENPELIEAIKTGRLREYESIRPSKLPNGRPAVDRYNELLAKTTLISEDIRFRNRNGYPEGEGPSYDPRANNAEMAALQVERRRALREADRLREEFPDLADGQKSFDLADKRASRAALKRRWEKAEWEMPETLNVDHRLHESRGDMGVFDDINRYSQAVSTTLYKPFKALSWVDRKGTRGSLFAQAYTRRKYVLERLGYSPEEATAFARVHAGEVTRDVMYDLSARTSTQRSLKNFFWFAPAWQEVLYTWAVKIPSESYWPIGAFGLVAKYKGITAALREVGVLKKDTNGDDIIMIPGLSRLVERVTGLKVPEITYGKLAGLNLVTTGGGVPGLSTAGNFALGKAALKLGGPFKAMSDVFQPYGPEASILPTPITYLHEAVFGEPAPWEFMSPELQKSRWDQTFDTGIQYAYAEMKAAGITPPLPEQFGTKNKDGTVTLTPDQEALYRQASDDYLHQLMSEGERYARGMAAIKLLGGTVAPMALYTTTKSREEWKTFFSEVVAPDGVGSKGLTDHQKQLIEDYIGEHPESTAFSVYQSEYGDKQRDLPFGESLDDAFFDDYYTGERKTMEPRDYSLKLMAIESLRHYQSRTDKVLDEISPSRDPWALLTSGFERTSAIQAEKEAWDRYLFLNPEADAILTRQRAAWLKHQSKEEPGVPVRSFEAERLGNTIDALKQISDQITGEAPVRPDELKTILADLQEMYSVHSEEFGKPNTPTEKAMGWWFDNVLQPYLDRTSTLYQLAQEAEARGLSPAPYYNEIRAFQNSATPTYKGRSTPSVESVFFGNKSQTEQKATVLKWRTRPLSWMSNFQLEKVGVTDPVVVDFLNDVSAYDEQFWNYVNQHGITGDDLDRYRAARLRSLQAAAEERGPAAVAALALNEAEPYIRLGEAGYGQGNSYWTSSTSAAGQIIATLEAADLSPKGFSEDALKYKSYLYSAIEQARAQDQAFDDLWSGLSNIMLLPNGVPREGALLYEAVLFGNFNDQVPYALASIGG